MFLDMSYYRIGGRTYDPQSMSETERACGPAWTKGDNLYALPSNTCFTNEEGEERARLMSDIQTYIEENQVKFVIGEKPMSEFDSFIETIKSMGIEDVADIYAAAVERYNNRASLIPERK